MRRLLQSAGLLSVAALLAGAVVATPATAQKRGGTLDFVVGSKIPSFDGHTETTFGTVHPIRPFYSLLIRVNPDNPGSPTDFSCDLCVGKVPEPTDGGTTYTFKIRKGVKFHDGTPLTSKDIEATFNKIIFPPQGVPSSRKAFFAMVKSISTPDNETVVFKLKNPSGSFLPSIAMPFNFVYAKKDIDTHGYRWHQKNVNGTGAFKFVEYQPGAFVRGVRYDGFHIKGKPYLDGFRAIQAPKAALRLQALRGDRAGAEFRGFPPKARDDMVNALGKDITVQEGDWNCSLFLTPNHQKKPFDDARVRRALTLSLDRWAGSQYLRKIAIMKTVGGIVFPGHPLAIKQSDLRKLSGFGNIEKSRAEAKRLLKEAGAEGLKFTLLNRNVDQPYKILGTWAIDQWRKIGLNVTQETVTTPIWYSKLRKTKDFDVSTDANCQSVVNPIADVAKFLGGQSNNYGNYKDPELQAIYNKLVVAATVADQAKLMRQFEKRAIDEQAHMMTSFWWYRIVLMRSYVKGWKTSPSHYLNQHLDNIWLDK